MSRRKERLRSWMIQPAWAWSHLAATPAVNLLKLFLFERFLIFNLENYFKSFAENLVPAASSSCKASNLLKSWHLKHNSSNTLSNILFGSPMCGFQNRIYLGLHRLTFGQQQIKSGNCTKSRRHLVRMQNRDKPPPFKGFHANLRSQFERHCHRHHFHCGISLFDSQIYDVCVWVRGSTSLGHFS